MDDDRTKTPPLKRVRKDLQLDELPTEERKTAVATLRAMAEAATTGDLGPALRFEPNARIEVLWTLSTVAAASPSKPSVAAAATSPSSKSEDATPAADDDADADDAEETETDHWWGATVLGRTSETHELPFEDGDGREDDPTPIRVPVYEIIYDAMPPDYPDKERARVCVTYEHELLDASSNVWLPWRHAGSNWEPAEVEDAPAAAKTGEATPAKVNYDDDDGPQATDPVLRAVEAILASSASTPVRARLERRRRRLQGLPASAEEEDDDAVFASGAAQAQENAHDNDNDSDSDLDLLPSAPAPLSREASQRAAEEMVDSLLTSIAQRHAPEMRGLSTSVQHVVADRIRAARTQLVRSISETLRTKGSVTSEDTQRIIASLGRLGSSSSSSTTTTPGSGSSSSQ